MVIFLLLAGVLGILSLFATGYLRPGGWRVLMIVLTGADLLVATAVWWRGQMGLTEEKIWAFGASLTLLLAAVAVQDPVGQRLTTVLYVLSGLFGALSLDLPELTVLMTLVVVSTVYIAWHAGDTGWPLVMHSAVVVLCAVGPCIVVSLLRAHLAGALEKSLHQASTDPLTGLANRRGLRDRAPAILNQARRTGDPVGLLLLDVDHFKAVNDTYGHQVGDEVLRDVATAIRSCVRTDDVVVRVGGEEMAVLTALPRAALVALGERIRAAVVRDCAVTVSVGIAWSVPDSADPDSILRVLTAQADELLYAAKHAGRNQVHSPALTQ
jgi:diguanylate cyclase (GGDEF)-like protein